MGRPRLAVFAAGLNETTPLRVLRGGVASAPGGALRGEAGRSPPQPRGGYGQFAPSVSKPLDAEVALKVPVHFEMSAVPSVAAAVAASP